MDMNDKKKSSPGWLIGVIAGGVLDVILVALLVVFLILPEGGGGSVKADVPENFEANADTYDDTEYELEYSSDAFVNFSGGSVKGESAGGKNTDDEGGKYSGFVFPDSDKVLLTDERISETVKDAETCRRAVNEMYARYGYEFTMQENIDFFNQYDWYRHMEKETDMDKISAAFSSIEKKNVDKLTLYEDNHNWN